MKMKLQVEGLQQAMRNLDRCSEDVCKVLGPAVKEGADVVRDFAKRRAKGSIAAAIESKVTWDKNKSKAFAAAYIPAKYNDQFVHITKDGKRYYIPTAVEYGHKLPGGGGSVFQIAYYKKGKKAGQMKPVKYAKEISKAVKPYPFMRPAYKSRVTRSAIKGFVAAAIQRALKERGG